MIKTSTNYKHAIKYADVESKFVYEDEAEKIESIQKSILNISQKETPYDAFICYKESDENGERTEDSVLAQRIYDELEQKGIRTFFARISLEDKLGKDYEPYIFAALRSAKVMLVVTTCNKHCESVWVKNEWSRYLSFMKNEDKAIIPVLKDMLPSELPEELARFQAQDMGKSDAIQELIKGIQKILGQPKVEKENCQKKNIVYIIIFMADAIKDAETKKCVERLVENIKFSDPVSNEKLEDIEKKLEIEIEELKQIILTENSEDIKEKCLSIEKTLKTRNELCKSLK